MSLINDALKRAKEAQQRQPPAAPGGPPLRPVEQRPARNHSVWLMLLFGIVVAAASILLWQWFQQSRQPQQLVVAGNPVPSTQTQSAPASVPATTPTAPIVAPVATLPPLQTNAASTDVRLTSVQPTPTNLPVATPPTLTSVATSAPPVAVQPPPVASAPPQPAAPKLQGILFHPTRPSAIINGKLLFVGESVGDLRVTAIDQESVTLVGGGKTNWLTLK